MSRKVKFDSGAEKCTIDTLVCGELNISRSDGAFLDPVTQG